MINNRSQQLIPEWHLEALCQCGTTKHSLLWHSGLSCRPLINRKPFTPIKLQRKTQKKLQAHLAYCTTLHPAYDEIFGTFYTLVIYINNDLKNDYLPHASSTMPLSGVVKRIFAALKAKHTKSAGFRRNVSSILIFPLDPHFRDQIMFNLANTSHGGKENCDSSAVLGCFRKDFLGLLFRVQECAFHSSHGFLNLRL